MPDSWHFPGRFLGGASRGRQGPFKIPTVQTHTEPLRGTEGPEQHLEEGRAARGGAPRAFVWRPLSPLSPFPLPAPPGPIVPGAGSPQTQCFPGSRRWWVRVQAPPPAALAEAAFQKQMLPSTTPPPPPPWVPGCLAPPGGGGRDPVAAGEGQGPRATAKPRAGAGDVAPSWDGSGRWCSGGLWGGRPRVPPTFPRAPPGWRGGVCGRGGRPGAVG